MRAVAVAFSLLGALSACGPGAARPPLLTDPAAGPGRSPPTPIVTTERGPRGGRLVFVDERGDRSAAVLADPDEPAVDSNPAWSPDGRWIAFASSRGRASLGESGLWMIAATGGEPRRLGASPAVERDPRWSPDGRTIVYASNAAGTFDLYRVELEVVDGAPSVRGAPARLTVAAGDELAPTFAPDGTALVYMALDRATGRSRLERIAAGGGPAAALTEGPADLTPAYAPDGRSIVFAAPVKGRGDLDLHAIDPDGRGRRVLVDGPDADETGPVFGGGGRFLFATAVFRSLDGRPILSSVVVVDLAARPRVARAMHDRSAVAARLGVAIAPGPLDVARLASNPPYGEALRRVIKDARRGDEPARRR